jgi:parallel beta-helix repeat protein
MNLETEDTGAVYTGGRDWIGSRGSVIRYNYFHDMLGYGRENGKWVSPHFAWGVYLDDNAGGVDVIGNIVVRASRAGIHLHNGRDNVIQNNVFVENALVQVEYSGWTEAHKYWTTHLPTMIKGYESVAHQPAWQNMRNMRLHPTQAVLPDKTIMSGNVLRRNIFYYRNPAAKLFRFSHVNFHYNTSDYNLVYHFGQPLVTGFSRIKAKAPAPNRDEWESWRATGQDQHSLRSDPLFVDPEKDDYRLRPDSPAFKLGFKTIPVEKIGPYRDPLRATWPIVEAEGAREKPLVSE